MPERPRLNDTLSGSAGNDSLVGGSGTDRLVELVSGNVSVSNTQFSGNGIDTLNNDIEQRRFQPRVRKWYSCRSRR